MDPTQYPARGLVLKPVDNQSIPQSTTYTSTAIGAAPIKRVRVWFKTKGATSTGKLQGSFDGTIWYDIQTLSSGINSIVELAEPYIRISVTNGNVISAETNDVWIYPQT